MTLPQILQHAIRFTKFNDAADVTLEQRNEVVESLNGATQEYFTLAPDHMKRTKVSSILNAPRTITEDFSLSVGETACSSGSPFNADERGQAVRLTGDSNLHEIVSTTAILEAYTGTAAATAGTVYYDTITFFDSSVERTITDLWARCQGSDTKYKLEQAERERRGSDYRNGGSSGTHGRDNQDYDHEKTTTRTIGTPQTYTIEYVGGSRSRDNDAVFMLRVDPVPASMMTITFEIDQLARVYRVDNLAESIVHPVEDERIESCFIPLLRERMLDTSFSTATRDQKARIEKGADRARYLIGQIPSNLIRKRQTLMTQRGF